MIWQQEHGLFFQNFSATITPILNRTPLSSTFASGLPPFSSDSGWSILPSFPPLPSRRSSPLISEAHAAPEWKACFSSFRSFQISLFLLVDRDLSSEPAEFPILFPFLPLRIVLSSSFFAIILFVVVFPAWGYCSQIGFLGVSF